MMDSGTCGIAVAPFVVVSPHDLDQIALNVLSHRQIVYGSSRANRDPRVDKGFIMIKMGLYEGRYQGPIFWGSKEIIEVGEKELA